MTQPDASAEHPEDTRPGPRLLLAGVTLLVIIGTAGVLSPVLQADDDDALRQTALVDMQRIVSGLRSYSHDTRTLPTGIQGRTDVAWLFGPGLLPAGNPFNTGGGKRPLDDVLLNDALGGESWSGPYLGELPVDPWERAYLVNVEGLVDGREHAMVLSAGPNQICETAATARKAEGDDVILPLN